MAHARDLQLYLRAEPSDAGRELLLLHRRRLGDVVRSLSLTPRLVDRRDLHRTEIFLGAPSVWSRALAATGKDLTVTSDHLAKLVSLPTPRRRILPAVPWRYDVFFTGRTTAVFVLRLRADTPHLADDLIAHAEAVLHTWEREDRLPPGTIARLLHHRLYPLARDRDDRKSHITLARGRVSPERQREVARTLWRTALASPAPITMERIDLRAVRSSVILARFAPPP